VAIDDQPGQAVGLAPDQAAELGGRPVAARGQGGVDAAGDEGRVDRLVDPGEDAAAERRPRVEQAAAHEAPAGVAHGDHATRGDVRDVGHVTLEDPRMGADALLVPALEPDDGAPGHGGSLPDSGRAARQRFRRTTTISSGCRERSSTWWGLKPKNHCTNSKPPARSTSPRSSWGNTMRDMCVCR